MFPDFETPPPSCRQFFSTIRRQFWPIFDPSPPLPIADVVYGRPLCISMLVRPNKSQLGDINFGGAFSLQFTFWRNISSIFLLLFLDFDVKYLPDPCENIDKGPFNNYVDKMRGQKMSVFVHAQGIKLVHAGEGGQKIAKFCPRSCWMPPWYYCL